MQATRLRSEHTSRTLQHPTVLINKATTQTYYSCPIIIIAFLDYWYLERFDRALAIKLGMQILESGISLLS